MNFLTWPVQARTKPVPFNVYQFNTLRTTFFLTGYKFGILVIDDITKAIFGGSV